jgi:hypothetical protein
MVKYAGGKNDFEKVMVLFRLTSAKMKKPCIVVHGFGFNSTGK